VLLLWLGPTDMAAIFVIALLLFGPDQLPKVARQLGDVMRHMQNTTQSFMLEMDRAAREAEFQPARETEDLSDVRTTEASTSEDQPEMASAPETTYAEPPAEDSGSGEPGQPPP
jgi:sec-independent protein translocase protein TatB